MSVYSLLRSSVIENTLITALNLMGLIVTSRLLSHDEIGIQVLTTIVVLFAAALKNFGIISFLIRHKSLNKRVDLTTVTKSLVKPTALLLRQFSAT